MQFTFRTYLLFVIAAVPLAFGLYWVTLLWVLIASAVFVADWRLSAKPHDWQIERSHDDRLSLAIPNQITITVYRRSGVRSVPIWVRDDPPPTFHLAPEARILAGTTELRQPLQLAYALTPPKRGDYGFGDLYLRWQSPLGLLRRQHRFEASEDVKVYPNLVDVKKYDLMLRKNRLWELGLRNAKIFGSGTEFERLRDYQPDDEYRRINWKATARRGKPISVEYETERSQNIVVMLDLGRMMRSPVGDIAKVDYAINAVLLLAYVAAQKGDKVGLLTFADGAQQWLPPRGGKGQFHRMLELLYGVESVMVEPNYDQAFGTLASRHKKRSLVLVFTDLTGSVTTDSLVAQMYRLQRQHLGLLVTLRDPSVQRLAEQSITDSASLYERTVATQLLEERQIIMDRLGRRGIQTLDIAADELSLAVIQRYLDLKSRVQI